MFDLESASLRRWPLAITFVVLCGLAAYSGFRFGIFPGETGLMLWGTVAASGVIGAAVIAWRGGREHGRAIARRPQDEADVELVSPAEPAGHPYRARLRRAARAIAPPLSGRAATALLLGCMLLCAVLIPASLGLPRWIEAELVLGLWWLAWSGTLTALLYRGWRLSDDLVYRWPTLSIGSGSSGSKGARSRTGRTAPAATRAARKARRASSRAWW